MEDIITPTQAPIQPNYAGFWRRLAAYLIDSAIFGIAFLPFTLLFLRNSGLWDLLVISSKMPKDSGDFIALFDPNYTLLIQNACREVSYFGLVQFIFLLLYFALWESSKFQATPGKLAARITVSDGTGKRLFFMRALGRNFCKIFSGIIFMVGYMMAGWTERRQALHDIIANCIVTAEPASEPATTFAYAGFWRRLVAYILDYLLLSIIVSPINIFLMPGTKNSPVKMLVNSITQQGTIDLPNINVLIRIMSVATVTAFITFFYFASWESSRFQATPGKMAIGLKVIDMKGNRLSFWRAAGRYVCKFVSNFTLLIGYMMAGWTKHRQALHDELNNCLVIKQS